MIYLICGIVLWSIVHFVPGLALQFRDGLIERLGAGPYRGVFSLVVLLALALIVIGWRSTPEVTLYYLPAWARLAGFALMVVAFLLFGAAQYPTVIKRIVRHPQLMSVVLWSISHLLTNGSTRAMVLFGGLGLWAIIEMLLINARDGAYTKPEAPGLGRELRGLAISAVIFVIALFLHPYFAGVPVIVR